MKKMINGKFTLLLLVLTLIFSSCSISIQKRRYRPGFYISLSKNNGKSKNNGRTIKSVDVVKVFEEGTDMDERILSPVSEVSTNIDSEIATDDDDSKTQKPTELCRNIDDIDISAEQTEAITQLDRKNYPPTFKNQKRLKPEKVTKTEKERKFTKRHLAILIGVSLLLMALIAAFSFPTFTSIFVQGNPVETGINLAANSSKFIASIFGWIGIAILDLLVSWGVYKYYKKDKPNSDKKKASKFDQSKLAGLTGLLRLIYTLFIISAIVALGLAKNAGTAAQSYHFLSAFNSIWRSGLIVFGLHLIVLGLTYKKEGGRKWFTILMKCLLIVAGIGYMVQNIALLLMPSQIAFLAAIESIFMIFMIVGEMAFALWMLIKGGKTMAHK